MQRSPSINIRTHIYDQSTSVCCFLSLSLSSNRAVNSYAESICFQSLICLWTTCLRMRMRIRMRMRVPVHGRVQVPVCESVYLFFNDVYLNFYTAITAMNANSNERKDYYDVDDVCNMFCIICQPVLLFIFLSCCRNGRGMRKAIYTHLRTHIVW